MIHNTLASHLFFCFVGAIKHFNMWLQTANLLKLSAVLKSRVIVIESLHKERHVTTLKRKAATSFLSLTTDKYCNSMQLDNV